ncbi:MAG: T9SS type A sorting domain-containing protein, partial [Calditrichaeota bacterium]|nr:T9SS type A sorting domain-containing protein [Calditrichota bacterium]
NWITAPNDLDEWAENVTALLDYLFHQKNYSCIKYLTLSNEPNPPHQGFWTPDRINKKLWYREMYKRTAQRLRAKHLREKVRLIGADEADTDDFSWFIYMAQHADSVIDVLASHTYAFDIDQPDYPAKIRSWVQQRTGLIAASAPSGTPFFVTEFGTNNGIGPYQNPDVDTFARGFFLVDFAVNAINEGTSLLSYWTLHDIWYQFGQLMQLGLWAYKDKDWQLRPSWFAWSTLSHIVRKGDKVVYAQVGQPENISAVALRGADGRTKLVVTNRSNRKFAVRFFIENAAGKEFSKYVYDQATISSVNEDYLPLSQTLILSGATDTLSAQSICFYNEIAPVGVREKNRKPIAPKTFGILQNYPNPFHKSTTIRFDLDRPRPVSLHVFNLRGELVKTLFVKSAVQNSSLKWDGRDKDGKMVAKGMYFLVLRSNEKMWSKKIIFYK